MNPRERQLRGALAACTRRLPGPWRERVLRSLLHPDRPGPGIRACVDIGDGLVLEASSDSLVGWHMVYLGQYEPEVRALFHHVLRPGKDAIDIGAHIGVHTLPLAKRAANGVVVACEPNPASFGDCFATSS